MNYSTMVFDKLPTYTIEFLATYQGMTSGMEKGLNKILIVLKSIARINSSNIGRIFFSTKIFIYEGQFSFE